MTLTNKSLEEAVDKLKELMPVKKEEVKEKKQRKKKEEDEDAITTSSYSNMNHHILAEQVYDGNTCSFAIYDFYKSEIRYSPELWVDGVCYKPLVGEEITKGAVLLPSKAEEYGTDDDLDNEIRKFILKWLDIPDDFLQFAIWNIKRSWVYDRFHTLNYLRALGDTGQGKTRFLDVLGSVHYKPIMTSGATTAAPIFRIIDKWRGTMIFDECDLKITDETADIIKIINMGYEKGKNVLRCDQNDATKIMFFDPFCPKVISTRKPFTDKAVESRCFTQVMLGTKRKDIPFNLNEEFFNDAMQLRNKLLMWRFNNFFAIDPSYRPDVDFSKLEPRVQQIFTGFMALFGKNQAQMEKFKTFIEEYQAELIDERQNSWEGQVVMALHDLLEKGERSISAQDIITQAGLTNDKDKPLKPRALVNVLRELGFGKSKLTRLADNQVKRCLPLDQDHLITLFARYGCNVVTIVTDVTETGNVFSIYENKSSKSEEGEKGGSTPNNRYIVTDEKISDSKSDVTVQNAISYNGYNGYKEDNGYNRYKDTPNLEWDEKSLVNLCCSWKIGDHEYCMDFPCNDLNGKPYCKKHFAEVQA